MIEEKINAKVESITRKAFKRSNLLTELNLEIEKLIRKNKFKKAERLIKFSKKQIKKFDRYEKKLNKDKYNNANKEAFNTLNNIVKCEKKRVERFKEGQTFDEEIAEEDLEKDDNKKFIRIQKKVNYLLEKMNNEIYSAYDISSGKMNAKKWKKVNKKLNKARARMIAYRVHERKHFDINKRNQVEFFDEKKVLFLNLANLSALILNKYNKYMNNELEVYHAEINEENNERNEEELNENINEIVEEIDENELENDSEEVPFNFDAEENTDEENVHEEDINNDEERIRRR